MNAHPRASDTAGTAPAEVAVSVRGLSKTFALRRSLRETLSRRASRLTAVDNVSFDVKRGEILGIVGESGSGKSTLARCLIGLERMDAGDVHCAGHRVSAQDRSQLRGLRSTTQIVFQDPAAALNPRMTIEAAVKEAVHVHGTAEGGRTDAFVAELFDLVGLQPELRARRPRQLSGGQRQRAVIARALAVRPQVLIADEAVSALDVSIQAQILGLLPDLKQRLGLTMIFISHQLSVVSFLCDRVAVMYRGEFVEEGTVEKVFRAPEHPYTRTLISAHPTPHVSSTPPIKP